MGDGTWGQLNDNCNGTFAILELYTASATLWGSSVSRLVGISSVSFSPSSLVP